MMKVLNFEASAIFEMTKAPNKKMDCEKQLTLKLD